MTDEAFRDAVAATLTCRVSAGARCGEATERFLARLFYVSGAYDDAQVGGGGRAV